jgi:dienelactone hydrolase
MSKPKINEMVMRTKTILLGSGILLIVLCVAFGQTGNPHQFAKIAAGPGRIISLTLTSGVPSSFRNYYDLFPIEASQNLVDWEPFATLLRTNRVTSALTFKNLDAASFDQRFYRTPTNQLFTPFLRSNGPHAVGAFSRLFDDPSRTNRVRHTNWQLMVNFWYPAAPRATQLPEPYLEKSIADSLTMKFHGHAIANALAIAGGTKFPVLLYSHGFEQHRRENTAKCEELASYGYVVAAMDHSDAFASVLPDGTVVRNTQLGQYNTDAELDLALKSLYPDRLRDFQFVLDSLAGINTNDPILAGRLDLERIGVFGFSFGGAVVTEIGRTDARCKAVVMVDGGTFKTNLVLQTGLIQPLLSMNSSRLHVPYRNSRLLFDLLTHDAYWLNIANSDHFDFADAPWIESPTDTARLRRGQITNRYTVSFFNKYLKGEDDHLLDSPSANYPEVDVFLKK